MLLINANFLVSILTFFVIPTLLLSFRQKQTVIKALVFSFIISIPGFFVLDSLGILNNSWVVPASALNLSIGSVHLPIEDWFLAFILSYTVIMYYENFYDMKKEKAHSKHLKTLVLLSFLAVLIVGTLLYTKSYLLEIRYAYLVYWGFFILLPIIIITFRHSVLRSRILKITAYFFYFFLLFEIVGVLLHHWEFLDGEYIGWVSLLHIKFPLEELILWCLFLSGSMVCYYEYFDDNVA